MSAWERRLKNRDDIDKNKNPAQKQDSTPLCNDMVGGAYVQLKISNESNAYCPIETCGARGHYVCKLNSIEPKIRNKKTV